MKFYGTITKGKLKVNDLRRAIDYIKDIDGEVEIRVRPTKDIRSLKMNNLYWRWLGLLSEESGYSKKELHNYFKTKLLCIEEKFLDEYVINCTSTSDLSVKDFSIYLRDVVQLASENFHFALPDPEGLIFR